MRVNIEFMVITGAAFEQALELAGQGSESMRLTREQVEELVLKRCWLSRYWGLAAKLGVYPDISHKIHATWAKLAPLPYEVVISGGQKAKDLAMDDFRKSTAGSQTRIVGNSVINSSKRNLVVTLDKRDEAIDLSQLLVVENGLRELNELKVEEAVLLTIAQNQNPALIWLGLSKEEAQDIRFKQAWLVYHWRREHVSRVVEQDVSEERLLYWISRNNKQHLSYDDAVDVERGLLEVQSLAIESQLRDVSTSWGFS